MKKTGLLLLTTILLPASLWAATISGQVRIGTTTGVGLAGVEIVITTGISTGARTDSAVSDSAGNYSITDTAIKTGAHTILLSKSGYNPSATLIAIQLDTSHVIVNPVIVSKMPSIVGVVKHASDSTPVINATVTLSGGPNGARSQTTHTDTLGRYSFDSIPTGTVYIVTVTAVNYLTASVTDIAETGNATTTVPTFYLTQPLEKLIVFVTSSGVGTPVIAGAKVVIWLGTVKVGSGFTNAAGQYTTSLNDSSYTLYTVKISAAGFRDSLGDSIKTVSILVAVGITTNLPEDLTPATSQVAGTVHETTVTGTGLDSAMVILQRRPTTDGAWFSIDTTYTDVNGEFLFSNQIAASGTGTTAREVAPVI